MKDSGSKSYFNMTILDPNKQTWKGVSLSTNTNECVKMQLTLRHNNVCFEKLL